MKLNMYSIYNVLSGLSDGIMTFRTDKLASVEIANMIVNVRHQNLDEFVLHNVGTYDNETEEINPTRPIVVDWDCRRFKEVNADAPVKDVERNIEELR